MHKTYSSGLQIKKGKLDDVNNIAYLAHEYDLYEHSLDKRVDVTSIKDYKKDIAKEIKKRRWKFLILSIKKTTIGFIDYKITKEGKTKVGIIGHIFLSSKYRKKGLGRLLTKRVLGDMQKQGCKIVRSGVYAKNKRAHRFWQKEGFKIDFNPTTYKIEMKLH